MPGMEPYCRQRQVDIRKKQGLSLVAYGCADVTLAARPFSVKLGASCVSNNETHVSGGSQVCGPPIATCGAPVRISQPARLAAT